MSQFETELLNYLFWIEAVLGFGLVMISLMLLQLLFALMRIARSLEKIAK